jgi:hypothetical protein
MLETVFQSVLANRLSDLIAGNDDRCFRVALFHIGQMFLTRTTVLYEAIRQSRDS